MKRKLITYGVVLPILLFALYTWGTLNYVYSHGERAGYLQKFSKKGWVFKTWEGEISMINLPGAAPEKFFFTVRDEAVAGRVQGYLGQRVTLQYNAHVGIPVKWFGDTSYFVTEVKPAADLNGAVPNTAT